MLQKGNYRRKVRNGDCGIMTPQNNLASKVTWDFGNAPGEVELGIRGSPWDIHAKDDTSDVIECHEARLAAQETQTDDVDILVAAAPQLASIRGAIETSKSVS